MIDSRCYDVAVVGGGIVGLATAMALAERPRLELIVLEAEGRLASHQTGHNSGVIHSGLYYRPGSRKALNCRAGREALYEFCERHAIPHERCGKVVVATEEREIPALEELARRGAANGLEGIRRLDRDGLRELEPNAEGVAALQVRETGIVDFVRVAEAFADEVRRRDGVIRTGARVSRVRRRPQEIHLETSAGTIRARSLINCGGLQSDRLARMAGLSPGLRIVPFRGEYYELVEGRRHLVRNLIYPVPDPRYPFLGVHFTRMIQGGVEAGPNAALALEREGYGRASFSLGDAIEVFTYAGFWRMLRHHWRMGLVELRRSFSKRHFVSALRKLVPSIGPDDVRRAGAGVRAQAVEPSGALVDDFRIVEGPRMIHVLNAPSPAATASISIGRDIARMASRNFELD